jgi:hypothetical protein
MKPNRREAISLLAGAAPIAVGMLSAAGVTNNALAQVTKPTLHVSALWNTLGN